MAENDLTSDPLYIAQGWMEEGHEVAIATVIETWGSAPAPMGSHLAIRADGLFAGSVSGGCVEVDVIAAAGDVLKSGEPQTFDFGVTDEVAWKAGLSCGGRMQVYLERIG